MKFDPKSGLWYRPERCDLPIIREQTFLRNLNFSVTDIFLDIGAHIGATTKMAIDEGLPSRIVCVEPDTSNFEMLKFNLKQYSSVSLLNAAVVRSDYSEKTISFFVNVRKSGASHSLIKIQGRQKVTVAAICFSELLDLYRPTVVKIDIEGYEYALLDELITLPKNIRALALELHTQRDEWVEQIDPFRQEMSKQFCAYNPNRKIVKGRFGRPTIWYRR